MPCITSAYLQASMCFQAISAHWQHQLLQWQRCGVIARSISQEAVQHCHNCHPLCIMLLHAFGLSSQCLEDGLILLTRAQLRLEVLQPKGAKPFRREMTNNNNDNALQLVMS